METCAPSIIIMKKTRRRSFESISMILDRFQAAYLSFIEAEGEILERTQLQMM